MIKSKEKVKKKNEDAGITISIFWFMVFNKTDDFFYNNYYIN